MRIPNTANNRKVPTITLIREHYNILNHSLALLTLVNQALHSLISC